MGRVTERRRVLRIRDGEPSTRPDTLVAEEPMEIRLDGRPLAITMRTPGDDYALAAGFLVSEGVVSRAWDVAAVVYCAGATQDGRNTYNVVDVRLAPGVPPPDITLERNVYTTSSCGLCGKAGLDAVRTTAAWPLADTPPVRVTPDLPALLPDRLRAAQRVFDRTGGLHAAGLFSPSGRASFELARKAVMAGIPVLASVSAPSSLAVDLAAETGLTLVGFLRGGSMNVYAGERRLDLRAGAGAGT
ncbi:formate dehydrogenase accessory sulfurtransferase FdhD [Streptomyces akebiae]|uniref:Formate dehydrogenase accessory sulfurtransferase FdhD n=1 Tax=Streptomyces akebiae TaxID=2865673 RepID=A0ABX8XHY2_9ACTN|nr:formate dehydrogenase accessory sulfurtransferase FdhD [Streptomyces akebiae]QYX75354.1 formate dehydrogenase accessory sulfurtransferase FdhD [Streptomyces akebiae]